MTNHKTCVRGILAVILALSFAFSANAQLPSVTGSVFHDTDLNGAIDNGELLVGVNVDLFEDDGDGIFNPSLDSLIGSQLTGPNGKYAFGGLGDSANYFVFQSAQTVAGMSIAASASGLLSAGSFNTIIDNFADQQRVDGNPIVPIGATNLAGADVIGGQRDLHVQYISGPAEASLFANPYGLNQVLEFNQSANVMAIATVTWDGNDSDMTTTPTNGLGGIDLTDGGLNEAFSFDIGIDAAGAGESLTLRVQSSSGLSTIAVPIPVTTDGTATSNQVVEFGDFVGTADFTDVDSIQLQLGGNNPSIDAQLGPIGLIGSSVANISVASVPEPSTCLLALFTVVWFAGKRGRKK